MKIIGLLIIIGIGYYVYNWKASVDEIKLVCSEISKGQNIQEVIHLIESSKYLKYSDSNFEDNELQQLMIFSKANMGRYACWIEHDTKVVITSHFSYSD